MKKLLSLCLALAVIAGCFAFTAAADDGESVVVCDTNVGDANGDGKISISDVSVMLKHIAKWSEVKIDPDKADVVNDDKVILSDVSMLLKYIAKWTSVRLGHNDAKNIVIAATCLSEGETRLTCKVCGDSCTVYPSKIPCDYRKAVVSVPTCAKEGLNRYTCSMCGKNYTESTPATGAHKYSSGKCTVCGKADPSVTKAQIFANYIKNEGDYLGNGLYSIGLYLEDDGFLYSCDYDTNTNNIYFSGMVIDESYDITSSVYIDIPLKGSSTYKFTYLCYDHVTDYDYFIASCKINPKTFAGQSTVRFTDYSVTTDIGNESMHASLAKTLADSSIYYAKLVLMISRLDVTIEDFGFIGYDD